MTLALEYGGLFLVAFLAATLLPAQSELALAGMIASGRYDTTLLIAVASLGNVLGSAANWLLGLYVTRFEDRKWFPVSRAQMKKAEGWYHRWGRWSLLLSWAPVIGDPLTLVAGVLREPFPIFLALVTIAKVGRYLAVAAVTNGLL